MRVVHAASELAATRGAAFVPTMGALHAGHLALVRRAAALGRPVVVSIFVNPTQFGPAEDCDRYPRTLEADVAAVESAGADVVYAPPVEDVYPPGEPVAVPPLPAAATRPGLEDSHRPGHFAGVCQVVARLFDLVRPSAAVFGEKDYQQLLVIEAMVAASGGRWPGLRIERHPTVRDAGGLALSSRNAHLRPEDREHALGLSRALAAGRDAYRGGLDPAAAERAMTETLTAQALVVDYAAVRDPKTLLPLPRRGPDTARGLIAARLGDVRLIDNMSYHSPRGGSRP